jgi:hypothetical protein
MIGFRAREQRTPPDAKRVTDVAITRFDHVFEVEPQLMREHVPQQQIPNWDTLRIVQGRHDHLEWMHRHWARVVVSGEQVLEGAEGGGNTVG